MAGILDAQVQALAQQVSQASQSPNSAVALQNLRAAKASFEEACARAGGGIPSTPGTNSDLAYSTLLAYAQSLLGPAVGQSYADQSGVGGLQRLWDVGHGGWELHLIDRTLTATVTDDSGFSTDVYTAGPDIEVVLPDNQQQGTPRRIIINTHESTVPSDGTRPAALTDIALAAKVIAAVNRSEVTIHATGYTGPEDFWTAARVMGVVRAGLAVTQIASGVAMALATGGAGAVPAWVVVARGFDEYKAGLDQIVTDNPNTRSYISKVIDSGTGNTNTTDWILFATDIGTGLASSRNLMTAKALKNKQIAESASTSAADGPSTALHLASTAIVEEVAEAGGRNVSPDASLASIIGGNPIDPSDLLRMRTAFEKNGGSILQNAEVDAIFFIALARWVQHT